MPEGQPKGLIRYKQDSHIHTHTCIPFSVIAHSFGSPAHICLHVHTHIFIDMRPQWHDRWKQNLAMRRSAAVPPSPSPSQFLITLGIANCLWFLFKLRIKCRAPLYAAHSPVNVICREDFATFIFLFPIRFYYFHNLFSLVYGAVIPSLSAC